MLISRVADHCFWFGRYLERAESTARTLAVTRTLVMEEFQTWWPVVIVAGEKERFVEVVGRDKAEDGDLVQEYMVWHSANPSSLAASVRALRSNARVIRDSLSVDVWEPLNELYWWMEDGSARRAYDDDPHEFYVRVRREMALLTGIISTSMLEDQPQEFVRLGSALERAGQTARVLNVHHHAIKKSKPNVVLENQLWLALLRACGGMQPFMRSHRGWVDGRGVARFLALEPRFPRSIEYALSAAEQSLIRIGLRIDSQMTEATHPGKVSIARVRELRHSLAASVPPVVDSEELHELLSSVVDEVHVISAQIAADFLGYPPSAVAQAQAQS